MMSIAVMKQALEAMKNAEVVYKELINAIYALQKTIEFEEMVKKGTRAWADVPHDWVDELRGGAEPEQQELNNEQRL